MSHPAHISLPGPESANCPERAHAGLSPTHPPPLGVGAAFKLRPFLFGPCLSCSGCTVDLGLYFLTSWLWICCVTADLPEDLDCGCPWSVPPDLLCSSRLGPMGLCCLWWALYPHLPCCHLWLLACWAVHPCPCNSLICSGVLGSEHSRGWLSACAGLHP